MTAPDCAHSGDECIGVYGNGGASRRRDAHHGYQGSKAERSQAMGIDWMSVRELSQAIPPAYALWIGAQLLTAVGAVAK